MMIIKKQEVKGMKARIRSEKNDEGRFVMVAILPDGEKEYPQEGLSHEKRSQVFDDARIMYNNQTWKWNDKKHTINI
jgi:hypothetical protein